MIRFILTVYDFFVRRRTLLFLLLIVLIAGCIASAYRLGFKEDIARFLPSDRENERINNAYRDVVLSNRIPSIAAPRTPPARRAPDRPKPSTHWLNGSARCPALTAYATCVTA